MKEIDLEKIRQDAVEEVTIGLGKDAYGDMLRLYADLASKVTKLMMEKCRQQPD